MSVSALPLAGVRVLDFSALGPGPFASRLLADYGADVITVEPPVDDPHDAQRMFGRGKRSIVMNLKDEAASALVLEMIRDVDVILEGMRPGRMEALGLGPHVVCANNPHLIYVRLTAFGQTGPLAQCAGHDINAIAVSGPLALTGVDQPLPASALLGDFASGSLMVVVGVLLALRQRESSGVGQVIDASMSDGAALLAGGMLPLLNRGALGPRGSNLLDGSRPFYTTYRCEDGRWLAVGAIEPRFFGNFLQTIGLADAVPPSQRYTTAFAAEMRSRIAARIAERSRDDWLKAFTGIDACVTPVLEPDELLDFPHHRHRGTFYQAEGGVHAYVAPRLSSVQWQRNKPAPRKGANTREVLIELGLAPEQVEYALRQGIIHQASAAQDEKDVQI